MVGIICVKGEGDDLAWLNLYPLIEHSWGTILWLAFLIEANTEDLRHAVDGILDV